MEEEKILGKDLEVEKSLETRVGSRSISLILLDPPDDLISRKISLDSGGVGKQGASRDVSESQRIAMDGRRRGWPGTFVRGRSSHPILRNFPSVSRASSLEMKSRMQQRRLSREVSRWGGRERRRRLELARRYRDKGVENEQSVISIRGREGKLRSNWHTFRRCSIDREKDRVWTGGNIGWIRVYSSSRRSLDCDPRTICANREAGLANKPNGRRPFPRTGEWWWAGHSDIFMIGLWNIGPMRARWSFPTLSSLLSTVTKWIALSRWT